MSNRNALCLVGAVGRVSVQYGDRHPDIYNSRVGKYININLPKKAIQKHILNVNQPVDIFIHCWSFDLKDQLIKLYSPVVAEFEDNRKYIKDFRELAKKRNGDYCQVSYSFSIKRCLALMHEHEIKNNFRYNRVITFRPDVMIWKDLNLNQYDVNKIYVNGHPNSCGDFHFVMSSENAERFAKLYDSVVQGKICPRTHGWIKNYVQTQLKQKLIMDDIKPGKHEEVYRKLLDYPIKQFKISKEFFKTYGFTDKDLVEIGIK